MTETGNSSGCIELGTRRDYLELRFFAICTRSTSLLQRRNVWSIILRLWFSTCWRSPLLRPRHRRAAGGAPRTLPAAGASAAAALPPACCASSGGSYRRGGPVCPTRRRWRACPSGGCPRRTCWTRLPTPASCCSFFVVVSQGGDKPERCTAKRRDWTESACVSMCMYYIGVWPGE